MNETWNRFSRHNSVETEFLTFIQFPFMYRKLHSTLIKMGTLLITYMNTYGVQVVHNVFAFSLVRKSVGIIVSKTFYHNLQTIIYSTNNVTVNHNRFYILY